MKVFNNALPSNRPNSVVCYCKCWCSQFFQYFERLFRVVAGRLLRRCFSLFDIYFLYLIKNLSSFRGLDLVSDSVFVCVTQVWEEFFACTCQTRAERLMIPLYLRVCKLGVWIYNQAINRNMQYNRFRNSLHLNICYPKKEKKTLPKLIEFDAGANWAPVSFSMICVCRDCLHLSGGNLWRK